MHIHMHIHIHIHIHTCTNTYTYIYTCLSLGYLLYTGEGETLEQSEQAAGLWYMVAAKQGHPEAQLTVGILFYRKGMLDEVE